jgi:hypothetical protein
VERRTADGRDFFCENVQKRAQWPNGHRESQLDADDLVPAGGTPMSNDAIMAIALFGGMALITLIYFLPEIVRSWEGARTKTNQAEADAANAALKREMVAKGFSADEIARVINAGSGTAPVEEKSAVPADRVKRE